MFDVSTHARLLTYLGGALFGFVSGFIRPFYIAIALCLICCFVVSVTIGQIVVAQAPTPRDAARIHMWMPITVVYFAWLAAVAAVPLFALSAWLRHTVFPRRDKRTDLATPVV
jgi:hypothetical protein